MLLKLNKCNQLSPNNYSVLLGYADYYSKLDYNTEKVYDYIKKVFEISNSNPSTRQNIWNYIDKNTRFEKFKQTKEYKKLERKFR